MARGKHSAQAAIRRAEAAHEHIDRLTEQLVEAKIRARRHEAAAVRLPAVEEELRRVTRQRDEGTSPEVQRLAGMLDHARAERDRCEEKARSATADIRKLMDWFVASFPGTSTEAMEEMFKVVGISDGTNATILWNEHERKLGAEGIQRVQRARGDRSRPHDAATPDPGLVPLSAFAGTRSDSDAPSPE
jgi:hypothetical protein